MDSESPRLESSNVGITLVGRFAPDEVLPQKLAESGVLSEAEARSAIFKNLVAGQVVEFSLNWGSILAVEQRLAIQTLTVPYVRIADVALKILREAQKQPIVTMFGINREYTYRYPSVAERDALGVALSPPSAWGPWGEGIAASMPETRSTLAKHGGLMTVTMRQADLDDREAGWIDVSVSAGPGDDERGWGFIIRINDHYQSSDKYDPQQLSMDGHQGSRTTRLLDALVANFDHSILRADGIVNGLLKP
jgi:hypothetical protein